MAIITTELAQDWTRFAEASLATRISDTQQVTAKVLNAVHAIATQLEDKTELESLLAVEGEAAVPSEILPLLHDVLKHLNSQDELSQLIAPLYTALQFEDRTRQKLEGLVAMMTVWSQVREDDAVSDEDIASQLMQHVVAMEQQAILARYFPDYIQVEEVSDDVEFF